MQHWSSADGPPPPWVLRLRAEAHEEPQLLWAKQLDAATDLSETLLTLKVAVDRIRDDVRTTTGLSLPYFLQGPGPDGEYACGPGLVVTFRPGDDIEAFIAAVADELSEWVSETLAEMGRVDQARTWPICPKHHHSLDPVMADGVASWQCRDDHHVRIRIGALGQR